MEERSGGAISKSILMAYLPPARAFAPGAPTRQGSPRHPRADIAEEVMRLRDHYKRLCVGGRLAGEVMGGHAQA